MSGETRSVDTRRRVVLENSPVGPLLIAATGNAVSALYMEIARYSPDPATFGPLAPDDHFLGGVVRQLQEYFAGERTEFEVAVDAGGTLFQRSVWEKLREIPYGQTWTYGRLAQALGRPSAGRAVGLANGRNPVSIIVPCHRVIGADGSLTGYGGGLKNKEILLELEGARSAATLF